jgi:hypothetical protein
LPFVSPGSHTPFGHSAPLDDEAGPLELELELETALELCALDATVVTESPEEDAAPP